MNRIHCEQARTKHLTQAWPITTLSDISRRFSVPAMGNHWDMPQAFYVADLEVSSSAFEDHGRIPDRYTDEGDDVSPPISWSGAPEQTASFAVVVHDPDAPLVDGFTHWVLYGIPAGVDHLDEGETGYTEGKNSLGGDGYKGPAPPPGHGSHHYFFWVYALDADLDLKPGLDRRQLFERIEDHVIEQARVVGVYSR